MGQVPIFFENAFVQVTYLLNDNPEKLTIDVTIDDPAVSAFTGKQFSVHLRKHDGVLEIPIKGTVDRAIKFQLVAKIFRQENIDN